MNMENYLKKKNQLIVNSITRSLNIIALLTKNRDWKQMFLSVKLYIRHSHPRSHFQSKYSIYFENGFLHVQAGYIVLLAKNICFWSLFFVKIATMFKLLVILFIVKHYAGNDIFKESLKILKNFGLIENI